MNPDIKALWVDALRSGDFEQSDKKLHVWNQDGDEMFCALGVLCAVAVDNGVDIPVVDYCYEESDWLDGEPEHMAGCYVYDDQTELLPTAVMAWAGLDTPSAYIEGLDASLVTINDIGTPFTEIANLIERHL